MTRTRRSILRTVSAATATAVGAGSVAAAGSTERSASEDSADASDSIRYSRIDTNSQDCGNGDSTTDVNQWGRFVRFSGTIPASTPCNEAVIESTAVEGETLVVTVGTESDGSEICVDCVGAIEYDGLLVLSRSADVEDVQVRNATDQDSDGGDVVAGTEIETVLSECGSADQTGDDPVQRIPVDGETVHFSGGMGAPDPCHEAAIESVERDGTTVEIAVDAVRPDDVEGCILCYGYLEYEGTVELADPDSVDEVVVRELA